MDADTKICHSGGFTSASSPRHELSSLCLLETIYTNISQQSRKYFFKNRKVFPNNKENISSKSGKFFSTIKKIFLQNQESISQQSIIFFFFQQSRKYFSTNYTNISQQSRIFFQQSRKYFQQTTQIFLNNQENISSEKYLYKYKCKFKLDDQVSVPAPGLIAWRGPSVHSRERKAVQGTLPLH